MDSLEGNNQGQEDERIERLRLILERQQSRAVTFEEAAEIGDCLMVFFQALGEEPAPADNAQPGELALGATNG